MDDPFVKKSLGQHWLKDEESLKDIVKAAGIKKTDTVLEIGPGMGALTRELVKVARKVIAVEIDEVLAQRLTAEVPAVNLIVRCQDIMQFNLNELPLNYKVVANIPYYLSGNILRMFTETAHAPQAMVLLVQKEVAERLAAKTGEMSILAVAAQLEYEVERGKTIGAEKFTPPPKVDSQVVVFKKRAKPLFKDFDQKRYMQIVKAGFSARRKKLRSSLAGGLGLAKDEADTLLESAKVNGNLRAQDLSLQQWHQIYKALMV
jgi:16S rRNA (adenine1518-N6/adenine1519-N6)-dimethyltransferase